MKGPQKGISKTRSWLVLGYLERFQKTTDGEKEPSMEHLTTREVANQGWVQVGVGVWATHMHRMPSSSNLGNRKQATSES